MPAAVPCPSCGTPFAAAGPFATCPRCFRPATMTVGPAPARPATFTHDGIPIAEAVDTEEPGTRADTLSPTGRPVETAVTGAPTVTLGGPAPAATPHTPASHAPTRTLPDAGQLVGRFVVKAALGEGAFGAVYRAHDPHLDRDVALKVAKPGALDTPERVQRFLREAKAAAGLRHSNIVPLYEAGVADGRYFIASAYIPGQTLEAEIQAAGGRPLEFRRAAEVVHKLAAALGYAHRHGVVHRDVKPANVLVDAAGEPHVLDFGLAARAGDDSLRTQDGKVLGTPAYMSPEQAAGKSAEASAASDQYALGVILFEALTGRRPFDGPIEVVLYQQVHTDPPRPRALNRAAPRDLETVALKCLEKDPKKRYLSCESLADDLRRWRDGEPITARRVGAVGRAARRVRQRPVLSALVVALLVAVGVAGWLVVQSGATRQAAALGREFDDGLDAGDWPAGHRERLEGVVGRLRAVSPERGDAADRRLTDRVGRRVQEALDRPRVAAADVPGLEAELAWLAPRDPAAADRLGAGLKARLRTWQPVFDLRPPFADLAAVFTPSAARRTPAGVAPVSAAATATKVPSAGPARLTAEFSPEWVDAREVGVLIDQTPGRPQSGCAFVLVPAAKGDTADRPAGKPPETFREAGGGAVVRIVRDGGPLREAAVVVPPGRLRVAAERDGDRVRVRVNDAAAVEFTDVVPVGGGAGAVFGVVCPGTVLLTRLTAETVVLPPAASPLERADDLFARGQFADALPLYEGQAGGGVADEAACKAGLCLVRLDRADDAASRLEPLAARPGDRWPVVAACHLWLVRLRQKRYADADAVFAVAAARFTRDQLARYIPQSVKRQIFDLSGLPPLSYAVADPDVVKRAEATFRVAELLLDDDGVFGRKYNLATAHALVGDEAKAFGLMHELVTACQDPVVATRHAGTLPWLGRWYGWLGPRTGRAQQAQDALTRVFDGWVNAAGPVPAGGKPPNGYTGVAALQVPLARLAVAKGDWGAAEWRVGRYLADPHAAEPGHYVFHAEGCLLQAELRERKGNAKGAAEARTAGTYRAFREKVPAARSYGELAPVGRYALLDATLAASLSGELTDEEGAALIRAVLAGLVNDPLVTQMVGTANLAPAVFREMWRTPRGREAARKMVLLDLSPAEYFRTPIRTMCHEKCRQDAFGGKPTPDQDEQAWQAIGRFGDLFFDGKIGTSQMLQLGLAWKGSAGALGWGGLSPGLKPPVRGPLAYLLGCRYLRLNKPADAKGLFATAAADAPPGSPLQKLAREELDRIGKK